MNLYISDTHFGHYHGDKEISDKEILLYKGLQSLGRNS